MRDRSSDNSLEQRHKMHTGHGKTSGMRLTTLVGEGAASCSGEVEPGGNELRLFSC